MLRTSHPGNRLGVPDRFHAQKLALEGFQEMRVQYRWQSLDAENEAIEQLKTTQNVYEPQVLSNDSYWPAVDTCSIKNRVIGPKASESGPVCCSIAILI